MSQNHSRKNVSRRTFLSRTLHGTSALALAFGGSEEKVWAAATSRRHLINIVVRGGWDSIWGHNGVSDRDLSGLAFGGSAPQWTDRYDGFQRRHPNGRSYLGPAMDPITDQTLRKTAIWRGIVQDGGGHDLSNITLNRGTLSSYAASYASLLAQARANLTGITLPLHYTQISADAKSVWSGSGLETGPAVAINIPTISSLRSLTNPPVNELPQDRRGYINTAIEQLVREFQYSATRRQSGQLSQAFWNGYSGAITLRGSNITADPEYVDTVRTYQNEAQKALLSRQYERVTRAGLPFILQENGDLSLAWRARVATIAFKFGLAEYLVSKNLSTVVEFAPSHSDYHDFNDEERLSLLLLYTCYQTLIQRLSSKTLPDGKNLLDCTTVVMHSEFDREPVLTVQDPRHESRPGTNHWDYASLLISGAGVKGNLVYGDFKTGPSGPYGAFKNDAVYAGLPIHPETGIPSLSSGARRFHQGSVFPTLLRILGVTIPPRQQTGAPIASGILI